MDDILIEPEEGQTKITVRTEIRRFRKPVTLVLGSNPKVHYTKTIAAELKKRFSAGGTVKEGYILLQADFKIETKETLMKLGFSESSIEVV